jgi:GMP synthase-like glutamine amidotransferase
VRALVVKPHRLSVTGLVGERLRERGFDLVDHVASEDGPLPGVDGFDAVLVMGAPWSVYGPEVAPWIEGVLELLREAARRDLGVLGVCFGAQATAAAFGGEVRRSARPELGWNWVETSDPSLVPAGPWFMWHSDTFDLPDGAREVARTTLGPQAFTRGRSVCVQFHPEADAAVVGGWMDHDDSDFRAAGIAPGDVLEETRRRENEARMRAHGLVDGFLEFAGVPSGR